MEKITENTQQIPIFPARPDANRANTRRSTDPKTILAKANSA